MNTTSIFPLLLAAVVMTGCQIEAEDSATADETEVTESVEEISDVSSEALTQILIPWYNYPNHWSDDDYLWDDLALASAQVDITAIINPNNGPDSGGPNSDYEIGLAELRAAEVTLLGYVASDYGYREIAEVEADIDIYDTLYDVDGIFIDEAASGYTDPTSVSYYQELYDYIKAKSNLDIVVINPGTHTHQDFFTTPATDTSVIFESNTGWTDYTPDSYVADYSADHFSMLFYDVADVETMQQAVDYAVTRNVSYVYITDDGGDNPWDSLPSYWQDELDYIAGYNTVKL